MHTLYDVAIPVFVRGPGNQKVWLARADGHAVGAGGLVG